MLTLPRVKGFMARFSRDRASRVLHIESLHRHPRYLVPRRVIFGVVGTDGYGAFEHDVGACSTCSTPTATCVGGAGTSRARTRPSDRKALSTTCDAVGFFQPAHRWPHGQAVQV